MDRNEKQNSFRNIQNSRGFDKKLKKYKTAFHISLAAAVIFAGSTGALGVQYLKNQDTETETKEVETASADNNKNDTAETENAKGKVTDTTDETKKTTVTEPPEEADVTPTGDSTETPTPEVTKKPARAAEFEKLSENLKDKLPENTSVHISGIGSYNGNSYGEISDTASDKITEYAKLFIVGKVYDILDGIRENADEVGDGEETDLAKIILGALNRSSDENADVYNDEKEKSSLEMLLRIGEGEDKKDKRKKEEDSDGYVSQDNKDEYDSDIKKGVDLVNEYIKTQLDNDKKIIKRDLTNTITLKDCETYMGKLLTAESDNISKLCTRLGDGNDDAGIVSAVPTDENITKIWMSGDVADSRKLTIMGIYDAAEGKGYILSTLYTDSTDEKDLSSTVYDTLMGNTDQSTDQNDGEKA